MVRGILVLCLKFRVLVVGVAAVVLALGVTQLPQAPLDVLPEFSPPQVQIQTEALGLSAAEVEQLVTVPLEQDLLNGVAWLDRIQSESAPGLSSIDLTFKSGTDLLHARQAVQERLTQAYALPSVGSPPVMIQPLSSTSRVEMVGLSAKNMSLIDLSVLARWKIKPRLMGIPGVANVSIWGQRDRQLQVQIDSKKLRDNGISLTQVLTTTGNALWVSSLSFVEASTPGTGGFIDTPNQRLGIQHVLPITTAKDLASVTVEDTTGRTLRLGEIANVAEDHQPLIGDAMVDNGSGLMLVIEKFPGANTAEVTKAVEDAMAALQPGLSGVQVDTGLYRPATFIETAIGNLGNWALIGLLGLIVLLGLYFFSWRVAVISFLALAVSLVTAMLVLYLTGTTFNTMVLAGLTIALGVLVDDAVADIDRIRQRLREHRQSGEEFSTAAVVTEAALSVRGPLMHATLILLLAPLPLFFLTGVTGAFSWPLALAYVLALAVSAVVALTVTPALATMLLSRAPLSRRSSPLVRLAQWGFDRTVPGFTRRPRWAYLTIVLLLASGFALLPQLASAGSFLPAQQNRNLLIHWQAAPGTSLPEMARITTAAERELRAVPGVQDVGAHVGRAIAADQQVNVDSSELWVTVAESADYKATLAALKRAVHGYPGVQGDVLTYEADRVNTVSGGPTDPLVVRVYGTDLDGLRGTADKVRQLVAGVGGVTDAKVRTQAKQPTLEVKVDLQQAQKYGIKPGDVRRTAATYFSGLPVGSIYQDQKIFDVVVTGSPTSQTAPNDVRNLLIDAPNGDHVRLGDIAAVDVTPYPTAIQHDATSRSIDVTANVSGRSVGSVTDEVRARLRDLAMPLEYHAEVLSDATDQQNQGWLTAGIVLAVAIGVFLLLQAAFHSWKLATAVFLTVPLAGAGSVLAAFGVGGIFSLGALVGLFTVLGLAMRNAVVLVRGYQDQVGLDGVLHVTRERVGPILLTALATAVIMIPLLVFGGAAGMEVLYPLAATVLGGLVTSTLLSLFVLPTLYSRMNQGD